MNALVSGRDITGLRLRHSLQLLWCLSCGAFPVLFHTKSFARGTSGKHPCALGGTTSSWLMVWKGGFIFC